MLSDNKNIWFELCIELYNEIIRNPTFQEITEESTHRWKCKGSLDEKKIKTINL